MAKSKKKRKNAASSNNDPSGVASLPTPMAAAISIREAHTNKNRNKRHRYQMNKKIRLAAAAQLNPLGALAQYHPQAFPPFLSLPSVPWSVPVIAPPPPPMVPTIAPTLAVPHSKKKKRKSEAKEKIEGASVPLGCAACLCGGQNGAGAGEVFAGFIFLCDGETKAECFRWRVFGLRKKQASVVEKIRVGAVLFLFDVKLRVLHGVYRAISDGLLDLEPQAFGGRFPAQVRFMINKESPSLPESVFKSAIEENYKSKNKFKPALNSQQVNKLLALFDPTAEHPQAIPQVIEDKHLQPSYLPSSEDPNRCVQLPSSSRYVPRVAPLANESQVPARQYGHAPYAVDPQGFHSVGPPPLNPCYPTAQTDPHYQWDHMRTNYPGNPISYPGNPIPYQRASSCEMRPREQLPYPPQYNCSISGYQDPNRSYTYYSQRPPFNGANVATVPFQPMCSCDAATPTYR